MWILRLASESFSRLLTYPLLTKTPTAGGNGYETDKKSFPSMRRQTVMTRSLVWYPSTPSTDQGKYGMSDVFTTDEIWLRGQ